MNNRKNGFGLLGLLITLAIFIAGGYWMWQNKAAVTTPTTNFSPPTYNMINWKTYKNEKYGFEMKYQPDLTVEFIATTTSDQVARFHVYDPNFDFSDKVGQEIRISYSEVIFTIYPYTKKSFAQKIKEYQSRIKEWNNDLPKEMIVKSQSGDIKVYELL